MTVAERIRIVVTALYSSGEAFYQDKSIPARVYMQKIEGTEVFREVAFRLVIPTREAEEFAEAVRSSPHVQIWVEGMKTKLEREV